MEDFIKTKFGLYDEDTPIYEGYYLPNNRWNGWLQPLVDEENFKKIVKEGVLMFFATPIISFNRGTPRVTFFLDTPAA